MGYKRLAAGDKPPAGSGVTLFQGTGDQRREVEEFEQSDNPEWVCPRTTNGFWYGYVTAAELADFA